MKTFIPSRFLSVLVLLGIFLMTSPAVRARNPEHLDEQFRTISGYLDQGEYEEGLKLINLIINGFGATALQELGPRFGRYLYLRGLFHLAMEDYEEAARNFVICYQTFANPRGGTARPNEYMDEAIVRHISCLMALERYEETLPLFERVNQSGLPNMNDLWALYLNRGLAMIRADQTDEGVEFLKGILQNTESPNITPSMRMEVVQLLVFHWARSASMADARPFAESIVPFVRDATPNDRKAANPFFLDAARTAFDRQEVEGSLMWLGFFDYDIANQAAQSAAADSSTRPPEEEALASALALTAAIYLELENPFGAIAAFQTLVETFPEHEEAAEYRYNMALSLISVGLYEDALETARTFREDYPESSYAPDLESTLLQLLIATGETENALIQSKKILARTPSDAATETAAFTLGVALYQSGDLDQAETAFDNYLRRFPVGENRSQALYYQAASQFELSRFSKAVTTLKTILQDPALGDLTSAVHLMLAQSYIQTGNLPQAASQLEILQTSFPESPEASSANLLAAQLKADAGESYAEVKAAFERTYETAVEDGDLQTAQTALKELLLLAARYQDAPAAAEAYQTYLSETSPQPAETVEILEASWQLLLEAGLKPTLRIQVRNLLEEEGVNRSSPLLTPLANLYRKVLLSEPKDLSPLIDLSENQDLPLPLQGSLLMARIDGLSPTEQAESDRLYAELTRRIPIEHMNTYTLTQLSRWYAQRGDSEEANRLRNTLLETRSQEPGFELALFDVSRIMASSDTPEAWEGALQNFQQVASMTEDEDLLEQSRLGIARMLSKQQKWAEAKEAWGTVLSNRSWVRARAESNFEFARSIEESGDARTALGYYVSIYSNFEKQTEWSAPSYVRAALIMDGQGKRREALLILQDMLRRMHEQDHPAVDRAKELFNQWKNEFIISR